MNRTTVPLMMLIAVFSMAMLAQPFEGTKWKIKLIPDDDSRKAGAKEIEDVVTFKGSKFSSETFVKQGFAASDYEEDVRGVISATFKAEVKSEKAGTAKWSGTVASVQMKGQLIITDKDGKQTTYNFQGEKIQN